ncbi:UNVERIFIED_CONTAM: hypothetical protein HDU68_009189 [Siphonaria sp. JEL0065]|nr:hypothetical protein HDU68_009189 [Siphonaria sp. JEL0065]
MDVDPPLIPDPKEEDVEEEMESGDVPMRPSSDIRNEQLPHSSETNGKTSKGRKPHFEVADDVMEALASEGFVRRSSRRNDK